MLVTVLVGDTKAGSSSRMTQYLPPNLLALFAPRDPIPYLTPLDQLPTEKKPWLYTGVSQYLSLFEVCVCVDS